MASNDDYQPPDLASVLRTLAAYGAPGQQPQQWQHAISAPPPPKSTYSQHQEQLQSWQVGGRGNAPENSSENVEGRTSSGTSQIAKTIDPATIIEWSAGLRLVIKTVAGRENILNDIRKMIKVQHEHEQQWWTGRQALIKQQEARAEGQQRLNEMLRAAGSTVTSGSSRTSPQEMEEELRGFDMKVYRAQTQMAREMTTKLKSIGIPFFGTRTELVRMKKKRNADNASTKGEEAVTVLEDGGRKMIDEDGLVELQRKMLGILEDLCSDDS